MSLFKYDTGDLKVVFTNSNLFKIHIIHVCSNPAFKVGFVARES